MDKLSKKETRTRDPPLEVYVPLIRGHTLSGCLIEKSGVPRDCSSCAFGSVHQNPGSMGAALNKKSGRLAFGCGCAIGKLLHAQEPVVIFCNAA